MIICDDCRYKHGKYCYWDGDKIYPSIISCGAYDKIHEPDETYGEQFDPGDCTVEEIKEMFPTKWPEITRWRERNLRAAPNYYNWQLVVWREK